MPQTPEPGKQPSTITLTGVRARGSHGLFDAEREAGQVFIVDAEIQLNIGMAAADDEVNYTVDYGEVAQTIHRFITGEPVNLIETLATRMAETILHEQPLIEHIAITVHKPQAPIPLDFADVAVTVHRSQS